MTDAFVIWGAGGHGKVVADIIRAQYGAAASLRYCDRDTTRKGEVAEPGGGRVELDDDDLDRALDSGELGPVVLAVGNNRARLEMFTRLRSHAVEMPTLIHPTASVSPSARLGEATHVVTGAIVHPAATVGSAVILNTRCVVEHDCVVGDGAHISPGAVLAGGVRVGARSWVGAGATVIPGVTIGADAVVGAGAVVIRDVPDGVTVVGVPAKVVGDAPPET